jgi:hypothetical protein
MGTGLYQIKVCLSLLDFLLIFYFSDGTIHIDTMTPTTLKVGFVSAVLDAGYHVKLASDGYYNAVTLHINPRQFNFQLPLATDASGGASS